MPFEVFSFKQRLLSHASYGWCTSWCQMKAKGHSYHLIPRRLIYPFSDGVIWTSSGGVGVRERPHFGKDLWNWPWKSATQKEIFEIDRKNLGFLRKRHPFQNPGEATGVISKIASVVVSMHHVVGNQ
jgi:hypothetical protein